eukprot:gnl/TRDRNA2_/TRDRNA2_163509_c2_seq2.p1 gnl/TRDRNA2_/TRDRNA2_163509_c2~~gnl/TRDRNA2_/TRDRNA2_163509_c2_seq2.p1  ORF type:complete len:103 (+),score=12.83 gnl/TRDRNA2_/TRDRNA2_163509_c2_seq2:130-438(+)
MYVETHGAERAIRGLKLHELQSTRSVLQSLWVGDSNGERARWQGLVPDAVSYTALLSACEPDRSMEVLAAIQLQRLPASYKETYWSTSTRIAELLAERTTYC